VAKISIIGVCGVLGCDQVPLMRVQPVGALKNGWMIRAVLCEQHVGLMSAGELKKANVSVIVEADAPQ